MSAPPPDRRRPNVILVEDDEDLLGALTFLFEVEGFGVQAFRDGETLLTAEIDDCACLIIDYGLPGMDGLEVIRRLRAQAVNVPVILITTPNKTVNGAAAMANVELVAKPLLNDRLLDWTKSALRLDSVALSGVQSKLAKPLKPPAP